MDRPRTAGIAPAGPTGHSPFAVRLPEDGPEDIVVHVGAAPPRSCAEPADRG